MNAYRPWSANLEAIDGTLSAILGTSHIHLDRIHMINNPNMGLTTTPEEFLEGCKKMEEMVGAYVTVDFACVMESLYADVCRKVDFPLLPIQLYLTYPWLESLE